MKYMINWHGIEGKEIEVTASFGVVFIDNNEIDVEKAIDVADNALYQAKGDGRNQVVLAS